MWTRDVQDVIFAILMCGWLGGLGIKNKPAETGKLLTIEDVGEILNGESDSSSLQREHGTMNNPQASTSKGASFPRKTRSAIIYAFRPLTSSQFR
jgi:hypothetical protein